MKIIFVEGLPGSGKTSYAKKIHQTFKEKNIQSHVYLEGSHHPIDLAWIAIMNPSQYKDLSMQYPTLTDQIESLSIKEGNQYFLAYTQIKIDASTKNFYSDCEQYEIYQKEDLSEFLNVHLERLRRFINAHKDEDDVYIFECILIQNHMNELLLKYGYQSEQIYHYFKQLLEPLQAIEYEVFYIQQMDVDSTLKRMSEERRTHDKSIHKDWIDMVIQYLSNTPYGSHYQDYNGCLAYFKIRLKAELDLIDKIDGHVHVFKLNNDYQKLWIDIKKQLAL